jgi:cyclin A
MQLQLDLNSNMRAILVDWLNEVAQEYKLRDDTLYLSINLTDRFLCACQIGRGKLQLVGITALFIASKYNELDPPKVEDFVYITDGTYDKEEVLKMEALMLNKLEFNLMVVTILDFVNLFLKGINADKITQDMTNYIAELTLQEYNMLQYLPSMVAASTIVVSLATLSLPFWCDALQELSGYKGYELNKCIQDVFGVHKNVYTGKSTLVAVREKYMKPKRSRVSTIPPTSSPPIFI